ncbi:MAG: NADH-quinone oxidoreductase subunit N [Chloroflexota bacterium]|nr:NADH-quinone oxidoreductase subunit N [Chloroflexota bacterium]
MTGRDLYLLSPELAMVGLALAVVVLDLVVKRRGVLPLVSVVGLLVPFVLAGFLWGTLHAQDRMQMVGLYDTLVVDRLALFFKFLVLGSVALVFMASTDYVDKKVPHRGEFYALVLLSATGMMLLAATRELISIYVSLELTALPLAALAAFLGDSRSSEAGMKFLVLSAISSALLLYGMALVYGFTGTTYLADIAQAVARSASDGPPFGSYALLMGGILIVAGFGFKIASVPFQMWVPDVYQGAPTPVTAFLSVASKAAGFAILLRVFYVAFPSVSADWDVLFAGLAAASMTVGNLVAVTQRDIKRMLGYSTIAHAGYLLVGVAAVSARAGGGDVSGPGGVLFYLAAYAATNLTAFFAIIAISSATGSDRIEDFSGMGQRAPWLAALLALAMVSLIGIPPTALFMGKLYLFTAAVKSGLLWLAVVGVVNSVLSAYYYLRVVRVMYLGKPAAKEPVPASLPFKLAVGVSGLGILALGVAPGPLLDAVQTAVRVVLP